MTKNWIIIILLCFSSNTFAQKVDVTVNFGTLIFVESGDLSFEYGLAKDWTVMLGVSYGNQFRSRLVYLPTQSAPTILEGKVRNLDVYAGVRKYFKPRQDMDRFFLGLYLTRDETFDLDDVFPTTKFEPRFGAQLDIGYKWVILQRLLLEAGLGVTYYNDGNTFDIEGIPIIRVGYRFGKQLKSINN